MKRLRQQLRRAHLCDRARLDEIIEDHSRAQFEQQVSDLEADIEDQIDSFALHAGVDLSDEEREMIFNKSLSLDPRDSGDPDVQEAFLKVVGDLREQQRFAALKAEKSKSDKARLAYAQEIADRAFGNRSRRS